MIKSKNPNICLPPEQAVGWTTSAGVNNEVANSCVVVSAELTTGS